MGKHYQALSEIVSSFIAPDECMQGGQYAKEYLLDLLKKAQYVQIPFLCYELMPILGMQDHEYHDYLKQFLIKGKSQKRALLMPYEVTGFETFESIAFVDPIDDSGFKLTSCCYSSDIPDDNFSYNPKINIFDNSYYGLEESARLFINHVDIISDLTDYSFPFRTKRIYDLEIVNGIRKDSSSIHSIMDHTELEDTLQRAAYIMHPSITKTRNIVH